MLDDELSFMWGYSSVVQHLTADREVPGSNADVPCFFKVKFPSPCRLGLARVPWTVH